MSRRGWPTGLRLAGNALLAFTLVVLAGCAGLADGSGAKPPGASQPAGSAPSELQPVAPRLAWSPVDGATGLLYAKDVSTRGQILHWLRLDLRDPTLVLRLTSAADKGRTLDRFPGASDALAAVNASFFTSQFEPRGWTVSDGEPWAPVLAADISPMLRCDRQQRCDMQLTPPIPAPTHYGADADADAGGGGSGSESAPSTGASPRIAPRPAHTPESKAEAGWMAVSGTPWLIRQGVARQPSDDEGCTFCAAKHPRTAVGLDSTGHLLTLVLAEGRQPAAQGLALADLARRMQAQGVVQALNLDGGGSTALLLKGRLVTGRPFNEPALRPLANALLVSRVPPTNASGEAPEAPHSAQRLQPLQLLAATPSPQTPAPASPDPTPLHP